MARTGFSRTAEAIFERNSDEINKLYAKHIPVYLTELQEAVAYGDQDSISYQSHKMCSAMKTIGFEDLSRLLEQIEHDNLDAATLDTILGEVEQMIGESLQVLSDRL